jgi:HK97 family phage major capsid protein
MTENDLDQARPLTGPWSLCNWERVESKEELIPVSGEASLALGSQGIQATWGLAETAMPAATDDKLSQLRFTQNRCLIQTIVSRDLLSDSQKVGRWLRYRGYRAIRLAIEASMLFGPGGTNSQGSPGPMGVIASPCTKGVLRNSGGAIAVGDIQSMISKLYVGCLRNAVWHCGVDTLQHIEALATSTQPPILLWRRPGLLPDGVIATIFGIPVVPLELCPAYGSIGDLILCDWTQYVLTYLQQSQTDSPLAFGFAPPNDQYHQGMVGLREDAVEARISDENLFSTDSLTINFKLRADGAFLWPQTKTTSASLSVGPAVVLT